MAEGQATPEFERLLEHLKHCRGFDFTAYKRSTLARRIDKRMTAAAVRSHAEYLDYLEVHPEEVGQLFNAILINVTSFFRDPETFEYLRASIVPKVLAARPADEHLRIWSAGCASGEECYSIAILFAEALGPDQFRDRVEIHATDVDDEELAIARAASYTDRQVENVPAELREKYFDRLGSRWVFKKDFRRCVMFDRHDLLDDAPISRVDLLVCRNTLMSFNREAQARIVSRFQYALREGGYLVLGKAEMLAGFPGVFAAADLKQRVFVKVLADVNHDRPLALSSAGREERPAAAATWTRLRDIAFDQDPSAQLVIDERGHLLLANIRARELLRLHARDIGRPLKDLELSHRPVELRSYIDDAHARRQLVQLRDVAWPTTGGEHRYFNLQVVPVEDGAETTLGTKIIFNDVTELREELNRSRQQLETAYEELQSTNEELETTNEELQSTIEELETTNGELQSTNEELETMNEELQSKNEKLETVNDELRQRGTDPTRANVLLGGILRRVPLGVVVMNHDRHIELWNDVATDLWGLRRDEVQGKHFFGLDIGLPVERLRQPILAALHSPDGLQVAVLDATNRRGRPLTVRVTCASIGGPPEHGLGIILLMQEVPNRDASAHMLE